MSELMSELKETSIQIIILTIGLIFMISLLIDSLISFESLYTIVITVAFSALIVYRLIYLLKDRANLIKRLKDLNDEEDDDKRM